MSLPIEAIGYHVGVIVEDVSDSSAVLQRMLGGTFVVWDFTKPAPIAIDPSYEDSTIRVSYGRYAGLVIELIQVLSGWGHYARWLDEHGPGLQHVGFWVPDIVTATREALLSGATLSSATIDASVASVTLPAQSAGDIAAMLLPGSVHVGIGALPVELEFVGPGSLQTLRDALGEAYAEILGPTPWEPDGAGWSPLGT